MAVHFHLAGGWGQCGLPLSKYQHTEDPSKVTCRRPGCRKVIPKAEQPRRVSLVIAPATAAHCGDGKEACRSYLSHSEECGAFGGKQLTYDEDAEAFHRLPECIASEVK